MTRGRRTCKILKEIRKQIAEKNDIEYVTSECTFQGECEGTCPKCEAELRYLENELNKRRQLGKVVAVAGISLGLASTFAACNTPQKQPDTPISKQKIIADTVNMDTIPAITQPKMSECLIEIVGDVIRLEDFEVEKENIDIFDDVVDVGEITPADVINTDKTSRNIHETAGIVFETLPEYPGGDEARIKFIQKNLVYPQEAKEQKVSGKVFVGFVVEADGSLTNFSILRSVHPLLDEEALRVVKLMPKWKSGEQMGKPVRVQYQFPITFSLDDEK